MKYILYSILSVVILHSLPIPVPAQTPPIDLRRTPVVEAYQKNKDAVVSISTKQTVQQRDSFFGVPFEDFPFPFGPRRAVTLSSLGSGFVIDPRGYIMTNAHVVEQADEITVILADNHQAQARKIAVDPSADMAVIKIDSENPLATVDMTFRGELLIGETVLAIGNPFGYQQTLTDGIISAIHRDLPVRDDLILPEMIQISAPINFGNSGGPLLNINGQLIGINTAIRKAAQNIGFAIPINQIRKKLPSLIHVDKTLRADLGIDVEDIEDAPAPAGVRISAVRPDTAAQRADLRPGDRISAIDNHPVRSAIDFYISLLEKPMGETFHFSVDRTQSPDAGGPKKFQANLVLRQRPKPDAPLLLEQKFGISVRILDENLIRQHGLAGQPGQLVVTKVELNSPAANAGIEPGDVLIGFNGQEFPSLDQLGAFLELLEPGAIVQITMNRTKSMAVGFRQIYQYTQSLRVRDVASPKKSMEL